MKENLIISACLLGTPCRYDGKSVKKIDLAPLLERYNLIPICPEIYGGLSTPRIPSERQGARVVMKDGTDVTEAFRRGAEATLNFAKLNGARRALLKAKSPSCGKGEIYDGSFTATLTDGVGVAAELLISMGIEVFTEDEMDKLL
ncbi:MAG: DUF523 domain-containing protein [Clostridia bacterium]|nr:DUF523 domain-containing protein [Clostridia bacterium]